MSHKIEPEHIRAAELINRKLPNPECELGRVQAIAQIIADSCSVSALREKVLEEFKKVIGAGRIPSPSNHFQEGWNAAIELVSADMGALKPSGKEGA